MARQKRTSQVLEIARQRLAGLKAITPPAVLGGTLSVEGYETEIDGYSAQRDTYNSKVADLDDETNQLDNREQRLSELNRRILAAVIAQYGPDSSEVELLGAVRVSDRKRPVRATKPPVPA
jgi:hypothetical protein